MESTSISGASSLAAFKEIDLETHLARAPHDGMGGRGGGGGGSEGSDANSGVIIG